MKGYIIIKIKINNDRYKGQTYDDIKYSLDEFGYEENDFELIEEHYEN